MLDVFVERHIASRRSHRSDVELRQVSSAWGRLLAGAHRRLGHLTAELAACWQEVWRVVAV
eukprot:CAMPEP_0182548062 /NCGR_PEP_ID=MMETSP1323-20130603/38314_1 /TAXON_ID=236787 /ORGANISM="Florenciella parvula, Strain RCC1693" /LENGTH=60 /DNA_ID=CAMNT_0024759425 /DNA_START=190 /DNA_END=369 /DNA_ORIENTATION=+